MSNGEVDLTEGFNSSLPTALASDVVLPEPARAARPTDPTDADIAAAVGALSFADEAAAGPDATRRELLASARRSMTPIRGLFVQRPRGSAQRGSMLAELVRGRHARALDTYLLLLALTPILEGTPLPNEVWARALSPEQGDLVSTAGMSKVWSTLEDFALVERRTRIRRMVDVMPLNESGSGEKYVRPGLDKRGTHKGYFWLPHEYWYYGWDQHLSLPGKAMLLIMLSATGLEPSFAMSYEQAPDWYGISERTAERGTKELLNAGILKEVVSKVATARAAAGYTYRHHRYLTGYFSTNDRKLAHKVMVTQTRTRRPVSTSVEEATAATAADLSETGQGGDHDG